MKLSLIFMAIICLTSCQNSEKQIPLSLEENDSIKEVKITTKTVLNQIENWQDSSILYVSLANSDRYSSGQFYHDSIFGYAIDSIPNSYSIGEDTAGAFIKFHCDRSAIIDVPSISKFNIHKHENHSFYGTIDQISPEIDWIDPDTFLLIPWERHLRDK